MSDLANSNQKRMNELAEQGFGLDPVLLLKMRVDLLTTVLTDASLVDEDSLNDKWEGYISDALDQAESELTRAKLLLALDSSESTIVDL